MTTTIKFFCPAGHALAVSARLGGTRAACPVCGAEVLVPVIEHSESEAIGAATSGAANLSQGPWAIVAEAPAAPVATGLDPLDEAPAAVWYVRPPAGGQFGPASALIMKSWIREGRVPGESLVWRAGWEQWQSAAAVFQNRGVELVAPDIPMDEIPDQIAPSIDAGPVAPEPKAMAAALPAGAPNNFSPVVFRRKLEREHSKQQMVVASLVLLVIAAVLVAIALYVIQ